MKIKRQMWKTIAVGTAVLLLTTAAVAQKPDLTFEYPPNWTPVLRVEKERLELHQYRSYRVIVTIQNKGTVRTGSFNVTAVIVRGGFCSSPIRQRARGAAGAWRSKSISGCWQPVLPAILNGPLLRTTLNELRAMRWIMRGPTSECVSCRAAVTARFRKWSMPCSTVGNQRRCWVWRRAGGAMTLPRLSASRPMLIRLPTLCSPAEHGVSTWGG